MRELIEETPAETLIRNDLRACIVPQTAEMLELNEVYLRVC